MPAGQTRCGNHPSITEPWRQRTQKQTLLDASRRLRERVAETEAFVSNAGERPGSAGGAALPLRCGEFN
jgi:hypothetical protein